MSTFELITILLSIVVGLGITRLLTGLVRVMELRASIWKKSGTAAKGLYL